MIGAFVQGVFELAKKPVYLLPALIISLAAFLVIILSAESYMAFFYSAIMLGQVPDAGILELPFYIISSYGQEIAIICASMLISLTLTLFQLYIYALSMARKEGMVQAIRDGAAKLPEIFGLVVFAALASFIYGVLGYALFAASITFDVIGIALFLLLIAWGLFGAYAFVKLIFVPVFMALEGKKLKAALSESWKWSSQRVFSIAIFPLLGRGFGNPYFFISPEGVFDYRLD